MSSMVMVLHEPQTPYSCYTQELFSALASWIICQLSNFGHRFVNFFPKKVETPISRIMLANFGRLQVGIQDYINILKRCKIQFTPK